ncbi:MAG: aldo/keto reductase [Sinobacteraceae bacterium]|nr:aldo/keto reductase [Nevskiaceae bacterium]MCP5470738.1 aldo/keto reductase [Nevskiaceae bacterium]
MTRRLEAEVERAATIVHDPVIAQMKSGMRLREFGRTGMTVSEVGFGSWAIGGEAYGQVSRQESLLALARAEELGCNFVDTAMVYGDAEQILGEFLSGRRSRWIVATKYSGQKPDLERTLEEQLTRLKTDYVDFYQIHWTPGRDEEHLYDALYRAKKAGKVRAVGVSLKNEQDIDRVLDHTQLDGFQVKLSLLDPYPFVARLGRLKASRPAVVIRSSLREGFLTGKFHKDTQFDDPNDQRSKLSREQIAQLVQDAERFRFLEAETGSMVVAAARYPLSFPEVSTVILGTKSVSQADSNFGKVPGSPLSTAALQQVFREQKALGLHPGRRLLTDYIRRIIQR